MCTHLYFFTVLILSEETIVMKESETVLRPISQALDILQAEKNAYMGVLIPTVTLCIKKLQRIQADGLGICDPLAEALIDGMRKRFEAQLNDDNIMLASAFKLNWVADCQKKQDLRSKMIDILNNTMTSFRSNQSAGELSDANDDDDFFRELDSHIEQTDNAKLVATFLQEKPGPVSLSTIPQVMQPHFIAFNTPIPSSAAVERLFSLGKDVLRPKRSRLTDEHFEMLVFLKESICTLKSEPVN